MFSESEKGEDYSSVWASNLEQRRNPTYLSSTPREHSNKTRRQYLMSIVQNLPVIFNNTKHTSFDTRILSAQISSLTQNTRNVHRIRNDEGPINPDDWVLWASEPTTGVRLSKINSLGFVHIDCRVCENCVEIRIHTWVQERDHWIMADTLKIMRNSYQSWALMPGLSSVTRTSLSSEVVFGELKSRYI